MKGGESMQGIQLISVERLKKERPAKKSPDYKDKVIAGEALVIVVLSILLYIAQAGPIW